MFCSLILANRNVIYAQNTTTVSNQEAIDLYELIGLQIHPEKYKNYFQCLGKFVTEEFASDITDYHYQNSGIQFRTNNEGIVIVIFFFNYQNISVLKPYKGGLPFGVNFTDDLEALESKLGEATILERRGFYGRTFGWQIEDKKIFIQAKLPSSQNESFLINTISISKMQSTQ